MESRFLRDERGTATMEFVVWFVPFMILLAMTVDASMLYLTHTEMWNVSRDIARRLSIGDMTEAEAVDYAREELFLYNNAYTMATDVSADVTVIIGTSFEDASLFGIFGKVIDGDLVARVVMRREPT
ncbi:MAG TPA: TadE/TadG family type IV pilus assembly protein [Thermohalobaculum sp.]|nr:TadE/TadG family type IV pilus assembly protein [Thermohalobaculum sp.]